MKKAFITGITGQDGSYLAELLLEKGYEVHGLVRRQSTLATERIDHLYQDPHVEGRTLFLHYGDLTDGTNLARLLAEIDPHEIYNLGAQSHVRVSFDCPEFTTNVDATGTVRLLEAIRSAGINRCRFYQASSSEMFGGVDCPPGGFTEESPFRPRSPYACAKVFSHYIVKNYREAYGLRASSGILFNHESPRRGATFVTRKITRGIAGILAKKQTKIYLGNLEACRDWGFAGDYVRAMWMMLQEHVPSDYVVATGETHSVREFLDICFSAVGLRWWEFVEQDERYFRPTEVPYLLGDSSKIQKVCGWKPQVTFQMLALMMLKSDLEAEGIHDLS
jgi:GDPmannose 4,6-dehydratase